MAPMTVPPLLVLRREEGIWKRVVEPILEMEKRVEAPPALLVEAIAKSVLLTYEEAARIERVA